MNQIIKAPDDDNYFGTNLDVNENDLIIVGYNSIYYYFKDTNNNNWQFKNKYTIPSSSSINFDYKVQIIDKNFIIGNYGFNDLEGALFSANIPIYDNDNTIINENTNISINRYNNRIYRMVFLLLISNLCALLIILIAVMFFKMTSIELNDKKKKKNEEEELSPYKVYSYLGYSENDDIPIIKYNPNSSPPYIYYNYNSYNNPYNNAYNNAYNNPYNNAYNNNFFKNDQLNDISKNEKIVKNEKIGKCEKISHEQIVTYKGYLYDEIKQKYKKDIKHLLDEIKNKKANI